MPLASPPRPSSPRIAERKIVEPPRAPAPPPDAAEAARRLWQERAGREISRDEARAMTRNLVGFFELLQEWSLDEKALGEPPRRAGKRLPR